MRKVNCIDALALLRGEVNSVRRLIRYMGVDDGIDGELVKWWLTGGR